MAAAPQEPDSRWMHLALDQAKRGLGLTSPNPPVGAVIVNYGKVIGQGYHHKAGGPHAEIEAIRDAQTYNPKLLPGATIFVTLEPCCTQGRTGPCTEAIKAAGIKRVVWGTIDPNPRHAGKAQEILTQSGIAVTVGVLQEECGELIRPFAKWVTTGIPYVIAKAGQSLDGRITRPPGEGPSITSEAAQAHGRRLRARSDAILVGAGTIRADNPRLTIRDSKATLKEQPYRVILSRSCQMPEGAHVFTDEHKHRTWVLRDLDFAGALKELGQRGIVTVLVEGGADILGQAFASRCVDEVVWYIAPRLCGNAALSTLGGPGLAESISLSGVKVMPIGDNVCITGHPVWPQQESQAAMP